jgi:N-acetylglucosaminyl-diphospho-decaprenol L-rhamnosyltransferase
VDLSIIVVNWNTLELLRNCLRSIYANVSNLDLEVIVVDNASSDGSQAMVETEFPQVRLIRNPSNVGFARANNQAIAISRGRYVLLLNSDAVLLPETVSSMVQVLDEKLEVGVVGAQLLNPDGSFQGSFADYPSLFGELLLASKLARFVYTPEYPNYPPQRSQQPRTCDWVSGACLMVRMAAISNVGVLDETYFMYSEETDWCYRMHKAGWSVYYQPAAKVIHWNGQSSKRVPERRRSLVYRSKWLFMRKHHSALAAGIFRAALLTVSAAKLLVWAARTARPSQRELAAQHVRSYRLVLSELARAAA